MVSRYRGTHALRTTAKMPVRNGVSRFRTNKPSPRAKRPERLPPGGCASLSIACHSGERLRRLQLNPLCRSSARRNLLASLDEL